jgi:hypothetical protein
MALVCTTCDGLGMQHHHESHAHAQIFFCCIHFPFPLLLFYSGAGAAGLAAAAAVKKQTSGSASIIVLEASAHIGNSWAQRYSRLCLHTPRSTSDLPGLPWPPGTPMYPSKAQVGGQVPVGASYQCLGVAAAAVLMPAC